MRLFNKACGAQLGSLLCAFLLNGGTAQAQTYPPAAPVSATPEVLAIPRDIGLQPLTPQESTVKPVAPLATTTDLWERIRRGYAMPDLDSPLVRDRETWYSARPDYIFRMTERSRKYLFHIVEELELRNMPTELALLPFVESAFNPQAVSSAKAAGMWQFMPATGRTFELKQNVFRDDRRDVLASTRAALDYLQKLYGMFGDWHLALAAYNWGEGSVGRAIAKNERLMLGTGYTDLTMPMETQFYVPKLQAIKNIVARPQAFGGDLPKIENHPYFQTVSIRRDIDVSLAAKLAEVPLDDFKALNPSLNKPVILAAGTPQILLPWDSADVFLQNLDRFAGSRLASWTVWVAPGTLRVADAAKQVGMSEAQLREINNIPKGMLIKPGSTLLVTRATHSATEVTEAVADRGEVAFAPEMVQVRKTVRAAKGDSVASIAKRYGTNPGNVAQWNKVATSASFKAGQKVVVYVSVNATRSKPATSSSAQTANRSTAKKPRAAPVKKAKT
jgi:membrane-bound lytic murein transglycosylase D